MSMSMPKAELTGVFLETLCYGIYIMVFIQCMNVLRRRPSRPSDYLLGTAVSLFILVTAHLVIDITRNMDAFTSNMSIPNYPNSYYNTFDTWKNIAKSALYVAVTIISDTFILYRFIIVWGRNYFIATIPFLLLLADIAVGILWVYTLSRIRVGDDVYTDTFSVRVKTFYCITLVLNVICTTLIAFQIWRIQKAVAPYAKGSQYELSCLVAIIVESGSFYSAVLVAMISSYASNSPVMFIFLNTMSPVIGIVFSSVIVRVGLGLSHGDSPTTFPASASANANANANARIPWSVRANRRYHQSDQASQTSHVGLPTGGVQVSLAQTVHTHIDGFPVASAEGAEVENQDDIKGYAV